jgi:phage baseplate assembly protein W
MATLNKLYSDIDFAFTKKPVGGDVALSYDEKAVIRSVRNLLSTKLYERPFNPELGSRIDSLLFENISPVTSNILEKEITNVINNYEPRVSISEIKVTPKPDQNSYSVTLVFYIGNATMLSTITIILERNR